MIRNDSVEDTDQLGLVICDKDVLIVQVNDLFDTRMSDPLAVRFELLHGERGRKGVVFVEGTHRSVIIIDIDVFISGSSK